MSVFTAEHPLMSPRSPFYLAMGPHNPYDDYLTWWYDDPNAAETTW